MGQPSSVQNRSAITFVVLCSVLALGFCSFAALGIWQLQRLAWKVDLIERVEARIHADPIPAPEKSVWPTISRDHDEYRHVRLHGHYLADHDTRVQAVTEFGSGFWILSPLQLANGDIVLINRGFVPANWTQTNQRDDERSSHEQANTETEIIGLLRLSEPNGAFLRSNDSANERWYSRDVNAIANARGLNNVAPYFVDLEAPVNSTQADWPRAGLTIVNFRNSHLSYALTWFALALLVAWGGWQLAAEQRKLRVRHSL